MIIKIAKKIQKLITMPKVIIHETEYYSNLFINNPSWNSKELNADESARWDVINKFIEKHIGTAGDSKIIDVGCGRGWLANKLTKFGHVIGIEPVAEVVEHARKLFPEIEFFATTPLEYVRSYGEGRFNLVVCSEVLEHVQNKKAFVKSLWMLLKEGGGLVLTTPRGELKEAWEMKYDKPSQPIEEWITTGKLIQLLEEEKFAIMETEYAFSDNIYQIHIAFKYN